MIIPSFPFCTTILLLLSRNVLALPQPGAVFSAPVKNGDIETHIASYQKASSALGLASQEHFQLGRAHFQKAWIGIPEESWKHHAEAAKHHSQTGVTLKNLKKQVDLKIKALETARDKGHDYHGAHNAPEMHRTAEHASKSAQISREAMKEMNRIVRTKVRRREEGHAATTMHDLNEKYVSTSNKALVESQRALL